MPDWSQFLGKCPDHPHTLVHPYGYCVSCFNEAEGKELQDMWRGARMQEIYRRQERKQDTKKAKPIAKADLLETECDRIMEELPRGTILVGSKFDYEIISKEPSSVDGGGSKLRWKVRVKNTQSKSTRWLMVDTIRMRLRRGDWEVELP